MKFKKLVKKMIKMNKEGTLPTPEEMGFTKVESPFGDLWIKKWSILQVSTPIFPNPK